MNFQLGHVHLVYLGLAIFTLLAAISGVFILKNILKTRTSDALSIYGSILVVLVAVIAFIYSLLHIVVHT